MRCTPCLLCVSTSLLLLLSLPDQPSRAENKDKEKDKDVELLKGEWALVKRTIPSGLVNQYKIDEKTGSNDENLTFDGLKVVTEFTYCDPNDTMVETVKLDTTQTPKWIDLTLTDASFPITKLKGRTRLGVYEIDGDLLRISVGKYDTQRPTGFKPGKGYDVFEYKRFKRG